MDEVQDSAFVFSHQSRGKHLLKLGQEQQTPWWLFQGSFGFGISPLSPEVVWIPCGSRLKKKIQRTTLGVLVVWFSTILRSSLFRSWDDSVWPRPKPCWSNEQLGCFQNIMAFHLVTNVLAKNPVVLAEFFYFRWLNVNDSLGSIPILLLRFQVWFFQSTFWLVGSPL